MRLVMPYVTRNLTSDLFEDVDRMLTDFSSPTETFFNEQEFLAGSEIAEGTDHYMVSVDLPGVKKEDIKIEAREDVLTISGERKRETVTNKDQKIQSTEKYYGSFKRSFRIPALAQTDKIEANYQDGVLQVYIPKAQAAQTRKIEVKSDKLGFFDKLTNKKTETATAEETLNPDFLTAK